MSAGHATAHSPRVRRSPAPRAPRRVSGPARTPAPQRQRAAMNGGAVALPQPGRRRAPARTAPRTLPRVIGALRHLPDARWLDRLLRGQTWVLLIGVALMGIVAMQVSLLKMNTGIGRAVETAGTLERQNADLRAAVSQLSSEERIQREAGEMGLVLPPAGDVRYVRIRGAEDARKAAQVMRPPSAPQPLTETQQAAIAGGAIVGATTADGVTPAAGTAPPAGTTPGAAQGTAQPAAGGTAAPGTTAQPQAAPTQQQPTGAAAAPAAGAATPVATGASAHGATPRAATGDGGRKGPSGGTSPEGATSGGAAG